MTSSLLTFAPSPSGVLTGLLLSILGTILTLIGLYLTYRKARLAASAADAATGAVASFKFRSLQHDTSRDVSEAAYALDTTRRHLNNSAWRDAIDSYEDARRAIVRMRMATTVIPEELRESLRKSSEQIRKFCEKVDAALADKGDFPDSEKAKAVIRKNYELLTSVQQMLHEGLSS